MDLLNKTLFVSKKLITENGRVYFDNFFAQVKDITEEAVIIVKAGGELENLPLDEDFYEKAEPGLYELEDGTSCEDPDCIAEFVIFENDTAYEKFKDDY